MLLTLNPYRIAINPSLLHSTAEDMLAQADKVEKLQAFLGWDPAPEVLVNGFAPFKAGKKFISYIEDNGLRMPLKQKRLSRGYPDLISGRKGIKGWIQKKFHDPKEIRLPVAYDALYWLRFSPRYMLLTSLHDALLSYVSTSEPRKIQLAEVSNYTSPIAEIIYQNDMARAELVRQALVSPLHKIPAESIIELFTGYVLQYDRKKSSAFYLG